MLKILTGLGDSSLFKALKALFDIEHTKNGKC